MWEKESEPVRTAWNSTPSVIRRRVLMSGRLPVGGVDSQVRAYQGRDVLVLCAGEVQPVTRERTFDRDQVDGAVLGVDGQPVRGHRSVEQVRTTAGGHRSASIRCAQAGWLLPA